MLAYDYFRQERIRKFITDSGKTGRPKAIVIDGCVLLHDLLAIGLATRTACDPEKVKKKHGKLKLLARVALTDAAEAPVLSLILAIADLRNAAAHEPISDSEFEDRFVTIWRPLSGGAEWPESVFTRSNYYRAMFSIIAFELGRWQVGLGPGGFLSGEQQIDWERMARS
jgi:hypothetical protein